MKKIYIICSMIFFTLTFYSQKLIIEIDSPNRVEPYSFKYNSSTGAWIYTDYTEESKKSTIITSKGKSKEYDYDNTYMAVFDDAGNVYNSAYNLVTDTTFTYYLLKNGEEAASFEYIGDSWSINNGVLYFLAKENNRSYIATYDTKTGSISGGKKYDDIYLVNFPEEYYEGEPVGSIGFTKNGEPYYLAVDNNEKFLVTGSTEQKHYPDIDWYTMKTDKNGELTYIAKSKGLFYVEGGNTFVVQGKKEYKEFDYIYGPVIFDKDNNPVYSASDSIGENKYRTRILRGNEEGKSYDGNIYEYKLTPSGKTAYTVSVSKTLPGKNEEVYENFIVIDGKEGKQYSSISNMKFTNSDVPFFTASDSKNKYFIVHGDKTISKKYDNIYDYTIEGDELTSYIGTNYGNYDKNIPDKNFVHISGEKYGPYEFVSMADYKTGHYVLTDNSGNFAYITGRMVVKDEYIYKYKVTAKNFESSEFDAIDQLSLSNGKVIYVAGTLYDKANYRYKYSLYINNKAAAENYDSIMDLNVEDKTGKITFIGCKGNSFYLVEI